MKLPAYMYDVLVNLPGYMYGLDQLRPGMEHHKRLSIATAPHSEACFCV